MIINKIDFPIYGVLILTSLILGSTYIVYNLRKEKISKEYILYFIVIFFTFSLFGSLIISKIIDKSFSLSSYYGMFSAIIASFIFNKIVPNKNIYLKYTILSLPLIYSIGKIGCFLAGCCYGIEYNHIFSVTYTFGLNKPLFPIQIIESISFLILFVLLNKLKKNNNIILITIISSATLKFLLDFLRYEHANILITKNQIISIVLIVISIIILIIKKNLKK